LQKEEEKRVSGNVFGWKWSFIGLVIIVLSLIAVLIQNYQETGAAFPIVIEKVSK